MKQNVTARRPKQNHKQHNTMMLPILAEALIGKAGLAVIGGGLGIGLIGAKAAESTGRNPASFGKVLVLSIILAALVEGLAFAALIMG